MREMDAVSYCTVQYCTLRSFSEFSLRRYPSPRESIFGHLLGGHSFGPYGVSVAVSLKAELNFAM